VFYESEPCNRKLLDTGRGTVLILAGLVAALTKRWARTGGEGFCQYVWFGISPSEDSQVFKADERADRQVQGYVPVYRTGWKPVTQESALAENLRRLSQDKEPIRPAQRPV
jgi:hypothetical protein